LEFPTAELLEIVYGKDEDFDPTDRTRSDVDGLTWAAKLYFARLYYTMTQQMRVHMLEAVKAVKELKDLESSKSEFCFSFIS